MSNRFFGLAFATGLLAIAWVGAGFVGTSWLALAMTALIAATYLLGAFELRQFRAATAGLASALENIPQPLAGLGEWLDRVPPALRQAVRLRTEGERGALPGPALTPYLVGLLVMLGMLGTFLGMVVTFKGAVFALEGSTDLQAIRSALAEPIKGLGLSFGTSVAGVAASAMLGLMSAISRRERLEASRLLDTRIASALRPFSLVHQRQETLRVLQAQAGALPAVVDKLESMMERIERRSQQLDEQLLGRNERLQQDVTRAYTELARQVGTALQDSLAAGARAAGDSLQPVVASAMAQVVQDSQRLHARLDDVARGQVEALSRQFDATARSVAQTWQSALQDHARTSDALAGRLGQSLASFGEVFEQRSAALLASVDDNLARSRAEQAEADRQRLQDWTQALQAMAAGLEGQWQRVGNETLAHQQALRLALEKTATDISRTAGEQASRTLEQVGQLLERSEALVGTRIETESRWVAQHGARMDQLAGLWRTELAALRQEEGSRGQAAVERLGELQEAVTRHLATLGAALEAPITRLLRTASEVPEAAAGVLAQLREEMSRVAERDNLALAERTLLLDKLGALLGSVTQAAGEQRAAVEALVGSASSVLEQAASRFAQALQAQAGQAEGLVAQATASAIELSSLGEAFGRSVETFQQGNDKLLESLQQLEASVQRSTARSDEQLAYYVAQAREVIDLSIASQQGLVDHLRQLQAKPVALVHGGRA
ncbi:MAG TPA: DUF802 domain-containing protein [Ramlibacter sp.]|jgi:hypothetical protein|uniref:DUF802 domain-containing protein n=1 Tax=Ramlibacter sp. TaxID=1917967 RepID=UPI002D5E0B7B|nr:DUF802 domain-containing protein [Ramlibacter sp.]HZY18808.1 DUF802 domain-containing protein [Ramlibacter sp.]